MKRFLMMGLVMVMSLSCLGGCGKEILYNARISGGTFQESFLKENMTYGAYYLNENYDSTEENGFRYIKDKTSPRTRTFIVTEQSKLEEIFSVYPNPLNFETQMLIVYIYTNCYNREQILETVKLEQGILKIDFKIRPGKFGYHDAAMPQQKTFAVELDKLDILGVEVSLLNPNG